MATGTYIETEEGERTIFGYSCQFNDGVGCHPKKHHCETCGWNPEVAKARLEKICNDLGISPPSK